MRAPYRTATWRVVGYKPKKKCERCNSKKDLRVHHKDRNPKNNVFSNLETLCRTCHTREHGEEILFAQRKEENRKRLSDTQRAAWQNKQSRVARLAKQKRYWSKKEHRLAQAERTREIFKNPESRNRLRIGTKASWNKERKILASRELKQRWRNTPEAEKKARAVAQSNRWRNPVWRANLSLKFKAAWVRRKQRNLKGR